MKPKRKYWKVGERDATRYTCFCGKRAVKEIFPNDFWCQSCIDKIPVVHDLHNQAETNRKKREAEFLAESNEEN